MPRPKIHLTPEALREAKRQRQARYYVKHGERLRAKAREVARRPDQRKRRNDYLRQWREKNHERYLANARAYQHTPKCKARRSEYLKRPEVKADCLNRSKAYYWRDPERSRAKNRRSKRKNAASVHQYSIRRAEFLTTNLADAYIRTLLRRRGFEREQITPELIETTRELLRLKREIYYNGNKQPVRPA